MNAINTARAPMLGPVRWVARGLGTALLLLWGSFFVAHLSWFADPTNLPPAWVAGVVELHFLMLLGFVLAWRWELAGGALILAASIPFFWVVAAPHNFPLFAGVTAIPAVLWLYCGWRGHSTGRAG